MKYKTTKKAVLENCYNVRSCGYCELSSLLYYTSPDAYTCGVYGWNFDIYELDGLTICTGYRNMPAKRDLKQCREYNEKARCIIEDRELTYEEKQTKVRKLLEDFIACNK